MRCVTTPLSVDDTCEYISHRMRVAGAKNESIFTPGACLAANHHSHGLPRVVNTLCAQALAIAASQGAGHVTSHMISEAAKKLPFPDGTPRGPQTRMRGSTGGTPTPPPVAGTSLSPEPPQSASKPRPPVPTHAQFPKMARRPEKYLPDHGRRPGLRVPGSRFAPAPAPVPTSASLAQARAENRFLRLLRDPALREWNGRMQTWWSAKLDQRQYHLFALLNIGLTGAVLLLLAQGPVPPVSWQHTLQSAVGFFGLILLDVALGLAAYIYLGRRLTLAQAQAPAKFFWAGYRRLSALLRHSAS